MAGKREQSAIGPDGHRLCEPHSMSAKALPIADQDGVAAASCAGELWAPLLAHAERQACKLRGLSYEDRQDIVQSAILDTWKAVGGLRISSEGALFGYFTRAFLSHAGMHRRRARHRAILELAPGLELLPACHASPLEFGDLSLTLITEEAPGFLRPWVDDLLAGYSVNQVAERDGVTCPTVYRRWQRVEAWIRAR